MKKLLSVLLIIVMCISMSSCVFSENVTISVDEKVKSIIKISVSKTELETIKETAKNKIGEIIEFGEDKEVFDYDSYEIIMETIYDFEEGAKTENIDGETYYYIEEEQTNTLKEFNSLNNSLQRKGEATTTDYWSYDKDGRMQELLSNIDGYETYEYLCAFLGVTVNVESLLKMPYKITKTNIPKVDDYTVDFAKIEDTKFAYIITEKSTADWTKSENICDEILKMAKEKIAASIIYSPKVSFRNTTSVEVVWIGDWAYDKVEVQQKIGKGKWKTLKTLQYGIGGCIAKNIKPNKTYYFRLRGFVENEDLGKVYGTASKATVLRTEKLLAPSVKLKAGKKSFTVKAAKKHKGVDYYQVKYSLKKNMKSPKTKTVDNLPVTIKKLNSGKTYYIQVRKVFLNDGLKKYYGNWTKVKKITVK